MRKIHAKVRAHLSHHRPTRWSVLAIAITCALYFGGALMVSQFDTGWYLTGWLALGALAAVTAIPVESA